MKIKSTATVVLACLGIVILLSARHRRIERGRSAPAAARAQQTTAVPHAKNLRQEPAGKSALGEKIGNYIAYQHPDHAPSWTVRYGEEFWRMPFETSIVPAGNLKRPAPASFNLQDIIGRVSHALERDSEALIAKDQSYIARFDRDGFALSPKRLVGTSVEGKGIDTTMSP